MASKLLFFHILLALAVLAVRLEGGVSLPVVHFLDRASGPIRLGIKAGGIVRATPVLSPGQDYALKINVDDVYFTAATFANQIADFHAYEPARDKGRAAVYWRGDNVGFSISYDKINWKPVAAWLSE